MEKFEYYEVIEDGTVFVREREYDFFALYSPYLREWIQPASLTFIGLTHDRPYKEITRAAAIEKAGGSSPEPLYLKHVAVIKENLS